MNHSFNVELAKRVGIPGAVFLHSLYFWIAKNQQDGRHFHDGRTWSFNTLNALLDVFPYWKRSQLHRLICKLRDSGLLLIGNYNKLPYDRTLWFALSDQALSILERQEPLQNRNMQGSKPGHHSSRNRDITCPESGTAIPDPYPDQNQISRGESECASFSQGQAAPCEALPATQGSPVEVDYADVFAATYRAYPRQEGRTGGEASYRAFLEGKKVINGLPHRLDHQQLYFAVQQYALDTGDRELKYIALFSTFMNGPVLDCVEKTVPYYEAFMEREHGKAWKEVRFVYV